MKIEVDRRLLGNALDLVSGAVLASTTMPVLNNVLLDFDGTFLKLVATDLNISIETRITARGVEKGRVSASCKKLHDLARMAPGNVIEIEEEAGKLRAKAGKIKCELPTIAGEDFPYIAFAGLEAAGESPAFDPFVLVRAFERVEHAMEAKADGYAINGALMHRVDEYIRCVASDGHRVAYSGIDAGLMSGLELDEKGILVPGNAVRLIVRLLKGSKEARISVAENKLLVLAGETRLLCNLLEGEFPEYPVVFPADLPFRMEIPKDELAASLKRLIPFSDNVYRHAALRVTNLGIEMECGNPDSGSLNDFIQLNHGQEPFKSALNVKYLADTVAAVKTEKIVFSWCDENHGLVFGEPDNDEVKYLIMPMIM